MTNPRSTHVRGSPLRKAVSGAQLRDLRRLASRRATAGVALAICSASCAATSPPFEAELDLPAQDEWVDCGPVLESGEDGEWDRLLWGGFASSVIQREGVFLLYYQGADGFHEGEGTVVNRAVGLAMSPDGVRFTKHPSNPVITFSDRGNHEEGATSTAPFVAGDGTVVMYYGANSSSGGEEVTASARMATSRDGQQFTDRGIALAFSDRSVWGAGDELFPIAAMDHGAEHVVFYIPNGTLQRGRLGVAWGAGRLDRTAAATEGGRSIQAWGSGSIVTMEAGVHVLFTAGGREEPYMEARAFSPTAPQRLSAPLQRYRWKDRVPRAVIRDEVTGTWLLYYRDADHATYGVLAAPASQGERLPAPCRALPAVSRP